MPSETSAPPAATRQRLRARGTIATGGERNAVHELHQSGGAKIRLPRSDHHALSAVLLNTAGGLTGDDRVHWRARAGAGTRLSVASAASEKVYRTHGPAAEQRTSLVLEPGARLDWLPQETILFERSRLRRTLEASLAPDARLLVCEALVFGRQASGETLRTATVHDEWRVHRDGALLHAEALRIDADVWSSDARGRGALHGIGAIATVLWCAPDGRETLTDLAAELHDTIDAFVTPHDTTRGDPHDVARDSTGDAADNVAGATAYRTGGASALEGRVVLRLAASSGFELRRMLLPCLARLQGDAPLPRVWHV